MPVVPTPGARVGWRPLRLPDARIDSGFWAERQRVNREVSIPQGGQRLREAGNLDDLRLAAEGVVDPARFRGPADGAAVPRDAGRRHPGGALHASGGASERAAIAGVANSMIPCIVRYVFLQRFCVQGLASGAVKG